MFGIMSWGEMMILLLAGLIILGPDRLPGTIKSVMGFVRTVRNYLNGTTEKLKQELGPELAQLREPLEQINKLRELHPKNIVSKHILGGQSLSDFLGVDEVHNNFSREFSPRHIPSDSQQPLKLGEDPPYDNEAT